MEEKKLNYEVRSNKTNFETRDLSNDENPTISGYFAVFGDTYSFDSMMSESIDRHAFDKTINGDIRALADHDTGKVLGRTSNGTLQLKLDDHGLWGSVSINPKDTEAMNYFERVKRGDISQCSFGFNILSQEPITREDGGTHWLVKEVELFECSIVAFPAYESTCISARNKQIDDMKKEKQKAWKENLIKKLRGEK